MKKIPDPYRMKRIYGPKLTKQELKTAKIRITTFLDEDIMTTLKDLAKDSGGKYQSVLNQILRDYLFGQKDGIVARISRLEEAVF